MSAEFYPVGFGSPSEASIDVLGGKGKNLFAMSSLGINVPPAIILPTTLCAGINAGTESTAALALQAYPYIDEIEKKFGYLPLFSVRSGAKVSCPGMCETILNVGLTSTTIKAWEKRIGERAAWDSYRRLIQMFGSVVFNISSSKYEVILDDVKEVEKVSTDAELSVQALKVICELFLGITPDFPQTFKMQLRRAIKAVYGSWNTERAITYRNLNKIPHDLGTACIIQAMVFGNMNDQSATGVLFTRNPSTGENKLVGEFLVNAQGEDVVSGVRTPLPLEDMPKIYKGVVQPAPGDGDFGESYYELVKVASKLEVAFADMQDIEFTIQDGELFILQTRNAKRTARAAVKVAVDLVFEGVIDRKTAFSRLSYDQYLTASRPVIDPSFSIAPTGKGLAASTGFATGVAVFSSEKAVELAKTKPVILLSKETTPDDIAGMNAAVGILTQTGGSSCHAAVVARGMDKVCVVGCLDLASGKDISGGEYWALNGSMIKEGDTVITIEGDTGNVWVDVNVPIIAADSKPELSTLSAWVHGEVPFTPLVTSGNYGYLDTRAFDKNPEQLTAVANDFEGIISIATSVESVSAYDSPLFELFEVFDYKKVSKSKLDSLAEAKPTKPVAIDLGFFSVTHKLKSKLTGIGFSLIGEINSVEDLLFAKGTVTFGDGLANKKDAVHKVLELKGFSGEPLIELVIARDSVPSVVPYQKLVASEDAVLKSLLSA